MNSPNCSRGRCGRPHPHHQRGAALVVAMLVFALCTALVVAMKSEFQRFYQRTANVLLADQAARRPVIIATNLSSSEQWAVHEASDLEDPVLRAAARIPPRV